MVCPFLRSKKRETLAIYMEMAETKKKQEYRTVKMSRID